MKEHDQPKDRGTEDLRVFLFFGIPIFLITVSLASFIVIVQPLRGQ